MGLEFHKLQCWVLLHQNLFMFYSESLAQNICANYGRAKYHALISAKLENFCR